MKTRKKDRKAIAAALPHTKPPLPLPALLLRIGLILVAAAAAGLLAAGVPATCPSRLPPPRA